MTCKRVKILLRPAQPFVRGGGERQQVDRRMGRARSRSIQSGENKTDSPAITNVANIPTELPSLGIVISISYINLKLFYQ